MQSDNHSSDVPRNKPNALPSANIFLSTGNTIAIYTVFCVLLRMREKLGLEAMLEYVAAYLKMIERRNPKVKTAVGQALQLTEVEKIYDDTVHSNDM